MSILWSWIRQYFDLTEKQDHIHHTDYEQGHSLQYTISNTAMTLYESPVKDKKMNFSTLSFPPPPTVRPSTPLPAAAVTPDREQVHFRPRYASTTSSTSTFLPSDTNDGDQKAHEMRGVLCTSPTENRRLSFVSVCSLSSSNYIATTAVADHEGAVCAPPDPELVPVLPEDCQCYRYYGRDFTQCVILVRTPLLTALSISIIAPGRMNVRISYR